MGVRDRYGYGCSLNRSLALLTTGGTLTIPQINQAGLDLIKSFEGCSLTAYDDGFGNWTIGYGHTPAEPGQTITQEYADTLLQQDLERFELAVNDDVSHDATPNQFAAMVSLCYNIGEGAFAGSTVLRDFNAGDIAGAKAGFALWNEANGQVVDGLVRRRAAEAALFGTP